MPFWAWLLIDLGVLAIGAVWWLSILLKLQRRGQRLLEAVQPAIDAVEKLAAASETPGVYQAPESDLHANPRDKERAWEARKDAAERKKQARQRRLMERLRK